MMDVCVLNVHHRQTAVKGRALLTICSLEGIEKLTSSPSSAWCVEKKSRPVDAPVSRIAKLEGRQRPRKSGQTS